MSANFKWMTPVKPGKPGYIAMREKIRQAMIDKGFSPTSLAKDAGLDRGYLYDYLVGDKDAMEAEKTASILRQLGLDSRTPLIAGAAPRRKDVGDGVIFGGYEGAGVWREPKTYSQKTSVPADPRFPVDHQRAYEVSGESHHWGAKNGDLLLVLTKGYTVLEGTNVLVRKRRDDLEQICVYKAHVFDHTTELWPVAYQVDDGIQPIDARKCQGGDCEIIGAILKIIKL
jgi:hypothetical protein